MKMNPFFTLSSSSAFLAGFRLTWRTRSTYLAALGIVATTVAQPLAVTTIAGQAGARGSGDGPGVTARFFGPSGPSADGVGGIYVVDSLNNTVRRITALGVVTTIAGGEINEITALPTRGYADGTGRSALFSTGFAVTSIANGPLITANYGALTMALDSQGNLYVADTLNHVIRKISSAGAVTTLAGSPGTSGSVNGVGGNAQFSSPYGVAADSAGNVYVADAGNNTLRKITLGGSVSTFAGRDGSNAGDRDGNGADARFISPSGVTIDRAGNVYVADTNNHTIRKISSAGTVTTLAGAAGSKGSSDGIGLKARFNGPTGIAVDSAGTIFVADTVNRTIRRITAAGVVSTIAGLAGSSGAVDGTGNAVRFTTPYGVAIDSAGNIFIADSGNNTVRKGVVSSAGTVTIQTQPKTQFVNLTTPVLFTVEASSTTAPTYQWRKNNVNVIGATAATYAIAAAQNSDEANYTVVVTSGSVSVTSSAAVLQVYPASIFIPPLILIAQPLAQSIRAGESATFVVEVVGSVTPSFRWQKNEVDIVGATSSTYLIASATGADAGTYRVVVSAGGDIQNSLSVDLSLSATGTAPVITTQPVSRLAAVETGVTFSVVATGSLGLTYQWKKDGGALADGSRITGSTAATLFVANLAAADAGSYTVVVANSSLSTTSSVAALTVVDVRATHAVGGAGYVPGSTVTVNSTVTYSGSCVGLAWTLLLPEGWTYASGGGTEGETKPRVGTPSLLEWAWTNIPASPVTFSTTLNVPSGAVGAKTLAASAIFRIAAGPLTMMVKPDPLTVSAALYHSADTGRDLRISLLELTRVIELYNTQIGTARTGCYKIEVGSEDGFTPESTRTASTVVTLASWHSADSNHDGKIGLVELTRLIELYNYRSGTIRTGEYHLQADTEDGFASGPAVSDGMVLIPGGTFTMGSVVASIARADKSDGLTDATHAVTLSTFYLAKTETTYADWIAVRTWAIDPARGLGVYDFGATVGEGKGDTHPVVSVSWYDVVKWCNAKSEREGLTPVYYTNDAQTLVYRTGDVNVTAAQVKWGANGYRLPTEAEWEYAARGAMSGQRFPWGDKITHVHANYYSSTSNAYDESATRGIHPTYATGASPYTSPVGVFAANGYGLSDMVGNVWEWTWDWYGSYGSGVVTDPRGAASGSLRVSRGGSWGNEASYARSAFRNFGDPDYRFNLFGFRPARSSVP